MMDESNAVLIWKTLCLYVVSARMSNASMMSDSIAYGIYAKYLNSSGSKPSGAGRIALTPKTITAISIVEIARYNV